MTFGSHRSLRQNSYLSLLSLGMTGFFKKSYKNNRTKFQGIPQGMSWDLFMPEGTRKAIKKHAGGMFLGRGRVPQEV